MSNYIPGGPVRSLHDGVEPGHGMVRSYGAALGSSQLRQIGKLGGQGPMRQIGALGAVAQGTLFNYRAAAEPLVKQVFSVMPFATHVVVAFDLDGKNPSVTPFSNQNTAGDAFEGVIATPGKRAYVAEFDRNGIMGEQFFAATAFFETRFSFEKLKSAAPWIIAGVVIIGGLIYYGKRKPTGRARSRSRVRGAIARARRRSR